MIDSTARDSLELYLIHHFDIYSHRLESLNEFNSYDKWQWFHFNSFHLSILFFFMFRFISKKILNPNVIMQVGLDECVSQESDITTTESCQQMFYLIYWRKYHRFDL